MNVFDLFAGCGGLSAGLTKAGLKVKWANEYWKPAAGTYKRIHPETKLFTDDARDLLEKLNQHSEELPRPGEADIIVGGPPCQGFSGFNRHRKPKDPRNSMLDVFLGFVDFLRPRIVVLENVPGLLSLDDGRVAEALLSSFSDIGYSTRVGLLQAGYYGLPQNRWRTFIYAASKGQPLPEYPLPTHEFDRIIIHGSSAFKVTPEIITPPNGADLFWNLKPRTTVQDAISDLPSVLDASLEGICRYTTEPSSEYQQNLRTDRETTTDHICPKVKAVTQERIDALPRIPGAGWLDLPDHLKPKNLARHGDQRYANRYGRLDWNGIFNTVLTRPHPYWSRVIHPEENRLISIRECARAQGFADSVVFDGKASERYKQVGNAVPPILAARIGEKIVESFA